MGGRHTALWQEKLRAGTSQRRSTSFPLWQPGEQVGAVTVRQGRQGAEVGRRQPCLPGRVCPASLGRARHSGGGPGVQGPWLGVQALWWISDGSQEMLDACVLWYVLPFTLHTALGYACGSSLGDVLGSDVTEGEARYVLGRLIALTNSQRVCITGGLRWCCPCLCVFTF